MGIYSADYPHYHFHYHKRLRLYQPITRLIQKNLIRLLQKLMNEQNHHLTQMPIDFHQKNHQHQGKNDHFRFELPVIFGN